MGLDISYYSNVRRLRDQSEDGEYDYDNEVSLYTNSEFPKQADGLLSGIYEVGDENGFRAGSYGGYNRWRDQLAAIAGYPLGKSENGPSHCIAIWNDEIADGPFYELINFSDCEGIIGPITSAKLAADFSEYRHAADKHSDEWFSSQYVLWQDAFEAAAQSGVVYFH